jgi:nicotinamidase-related amidase
MSIPDFYDPQQVGKLFPPQTPQAVDAGQHANMSPASEDKKRIALLLVDEQVDFIHADGSLSVPGAVEDTRRIVEWIYQHTERITTLAASLDSHIPIQIFFPTWWVDAQEQHPTPFTVISSADVVAARWRPLYETEWSVDYVKQLEDHAKKQLMIWPYHVLIGTPGHTLTPTLYEAIAYHAAARRTQPVFLTKGTIPKTEHYSILEPEVKVPNEPLGELNTDFLHMLAGHDLIYIAGQAKSHCVLETVNSIMRYFADQPKTIQKFRILMDCTSSVVHPEIDFDTLANAAFAEFAAQGLKLVSSTDGIE